MSDISPIHVRQHQRNRSLDLLRIFFAILVLLAHAPELTDGDRHREILSRLTRSSMTLGELGVEGFFMLSGYLIVQSWLGDPELLNYLRKRILRIVPGYVVAVMLSTLLLGVVAPAAPGFFKQFNRHFLTSVLQLSAPVTPPVLPGAHYHGVNGSLWTITYEFRCYLVVAIFGMCGLLKRPAVWLGATVFLLAGLLLPNLAQHLIRPWFQAITGGSEVVFRLGAAYFVGGCFHFYAKRLLFRPWLAALSIAIVLLTGIFSPSHLQAALLPFGGYLMFSLSQVRGGRLGFMQRFPDISYGIYLYGWPVEALWIWYHPGRPWIAFAVSTILCLGLGWLSWELVERPMLTFKRRSTAPLPA